MDAQRTLRRQIGCVGIGLHSGNKVTLSLKPAPADFGIRFRRTDLGGHDVPATVHHLAGIQLATGLARNEVSNNALRFEDEFVRHKILDAVGDLALVGFPVIGHLVAHRAGHALHTEFAAKILDETQAWRLVEAMADGPVIPASLAAVKSAAARLA
jgi:UDP-3-O-acyl-N-acetylglucosamine deacetylase